MTGMIVSGFRRAQGDVCAVADIDPLGAAVKQLLDHVLVVFHGRLVYSPCGYDNHLPNGVPHNKRINFFMPAIFLAL